MDGKQLLFKLHCWALIRAGAPTQVRAKSQGQAPCGCGLARFGCGWASLAMVLQRVFQDCVFKILHQEEVKLR